MLARSQWNWEDKNPHKTIMLKSFELFSLIIKIIYLFIYLLWFFCLYRIHLSTEKLASNTFYSTRLFKFYATIYLFYIVSYLCPWMWSLLDWMFGMVVKVLHQRPLLSQSSLTTFGCFVFFCYCFGALVLAFLPPYGNWVSDENSV